MKSFRKLFEDNQKNQNLEIGNTALAGQFSKNSNRFRFSEKDVVNFNNTVTEEVHYQRIVNELKLISDNFTNDKKFPAISTETFPKTLKDFKELLNSTFGLQQKTSIDDENLQGTISKIYDNKKIIVPIITRALITGKNAFEGMSKDEYQLTK